MPFLDEDGVTRLTEDYLDIFAPKEELAQVEDAVAELTTEVAIQKTHDKFYIAYHLDGQTLYPSIFRRSDV